jgi:fused signal recognition particle receptor
MFNLSRRKQLIDNGTRRTREAWFNRIGKILHVGNNDWDAWDDLEEVLISADLGVSAATDLVQKTKVKVELQGGTADPTEVLKVLKAEMRQLLGDHTRRILSLIEPSQLNASPVIIIVVGVNGSGKTTSIAKLTHYLNEDGHSVILGAADTFRPAAINQLRIWAERLKTNIVAHQPGGDSAAVVFDTIRAGQARHIDVVIIDTAGRLHTKSNLMEELKKVRRTIYRLDGSAPHLTLLALDANTGQNGLAQAKGFIEAVGCNGIFLTKMDGTAKGGIVFAIQQELGLPVLFIGTGEDLEDIAPFDSNEFIESLFMTANDDI